MLTKDAIAYFGSRAALAHALGIAAPSTYDWGKRVPPLRQLQLQTLTLGRLKAAPDVFNRKAKQAA